MASKRSKKYRKPRKATVKPHLISLRSKKESVEIKDARRVALEYEFDVNDNEDWD